MHVAVVLESTLNKQNMGGESHVATKILIEALKYLTSERGIMVRPLSAIVSDASPTYDSFLRITNTTTSPEDLRPYKILILRMFLPDIYLPLYVCNTEKAVEVAATTKTEVAVEKAGFNGCWTKVICLAINFLKVDSASRSLDDEEEPKWMDTGWTKLHVRVFRLMPLPEVRNKMGEVDVNTLTMEQYLALTRGNQAPGVVKPGIGGNVNFEIESQFMRELREDMFSGSNNDNPHEHVERILDIVSLFNIPRVTHDAVMLRSSRDIVHHPKQLQDIHNFKQEGDETLYQAWERKVSSGNSVGIVAIANKLDSLRHDIKKLKENVHAIQVGCETCGGAHLDNDCLLRKEVKSIEEVKYRESGRPFPSKGGNGDRYRVGSRGYYLRVNDRPPFGERKLSLTEIINKYMEQSVKKQVEKDEWLRKFHKNTEANRERHDEIIRNLETKVKTLAREVEGRATEAKFEECKAIFIEDGSPLYTPFYYSLKEIKYFSANSGFSDDENQEIKEAVEIEEIITHPETTPPMVSPCQPKKVSYYVAPYEPPIPLPGRLTQHAEEALVHKTMESLKWIRINRPLLKEIRQTKDYAKHIKNLVVNKPRTSENKDVKMNPRCSALL
ncbi:hypothetical protein Tco_1351357 [Tanacetum coccineum]